MAPLTTFKSVEIPSISKLQQIITHWDNLNLDRQDDPLPKLKEYLSNAKDGKVPVLYAHSAKAKIPGRQFVRNGCGLQSFQKAIRHTIAGDTYRDYDIVNAHPVILDQYCEKNGIGHSYLSGYVKAREVIIDKTLRMPRDDAKKLVLSVLNGGLAEYKQIEEKSAWLCCFKDEIQDIHSKIAEKNPELVKAVKATKEYNVNGSVMNHLLCDIENQILCSCIEFLKLNGIPVDNIVLVFDGFMLPKGLEIDLGAMTAYVEQKTTYRVSMVEKPMTSGLDLSGYPEPMDEDATPFGEFERTHFKVMRPICFARETHTEVQLLNKTELQTMYEHVPAPNKHSSFIQSWLTQENIRTYEKLDMLPPPLAVPADTYNLWRGYPASRMPTTGSHELGIQHIRNLFPSDSEWVITWLAHIVQKPGCKTGVCPVVIGGQGAGKGFLFEQIMGRIMGRYFAHTSDPEHSLFARFAENRNGKMLVNVDDCNVGAMKMNADPFKSFITGERMEYEQKGKQTISLLNCSNYVMTTNNENPVKLDTDDRRYAVLECSKKLVGNAWYFQELRAYVEDDANIGALWQFFTEWDLTKINLVKDRPMSQLYADMKMLGADKELLFLGSLVQSNTKNFEKKADEMYDGFRTWLHESGFPDYKPRSKISFGMYLKKVSGVESIKRSVMLYQFDIKQVSAYLARNGVNVEGVCLL